MSNSMNLEKDLIDEELHQESSLNSCLEKETKKSASGIFEIFYRMKKIFLLANQISIFKKSFDKNIQSQVP